MSQEKQYSIKVDAIKEQDIKSFDILNPPPAGLYRITNLDVDEYYVGIHKYKKGEFPGDGKYWHSSKNKKFKAICSNPSSNLKYEILEYGDYDVMTYKEWLILDDVDAKNHPKWYNDSNGSPKFKPPNDIKVKKLADRILKYSTMKYKELIKKDASGKSMIDDCEFDIQLEDREEIYNTDGIQAKVEMDDSLILHIMDSVSRKLGDVGECKPVTIIDGKTFNGFHTKTGVYRAKHATDVPTLRVNKKEIKGWTDSEKRILANYLNPKDSDRKREMSKKDAVKMIVGFYKDSKVPANFITNYALLDDMNFDEREVDSIISKAQREIARNIVSPTETHIHWKGEGWSKELNKVEESTRKAFPNAIVYAQSVEALDLKGLEKVHDALFDEDLIEIDNPPNELIIFPHCPDPDSITKWDDGGEGDKFKNKLKLFLDGIGMKYRIIMMPYRRPDTNINPENFWNTRKGKIWLGENNIILEDIK